jgi:hypothetical protein
MTSKPQMPAHSTEFTLSAAEWAQGRICAGTSFTQPLQQGLGSLSLFIPNQLISRQEKSLDYENYDKRGKDKGILIINFLHCRSFFHQSHDPIRPGARVDEPICMLENPASDGINLADSNAVTAVQESHAVLI